MRDGASGRSRGFGFLTFKDVKTVNIVMVKEHWLDGKIVSTFLAFDFSEGKSIYVLEMNAPGVYCRHFPFSYLI